MNTPIRLRYFLWLSLLLCIIFAVQTLGWFLYEFSEWLRGVHEPMPKELTELLILQTINLVMLPLFLIIFWVVSKKMLRPLRSIAHTAQAISVGQLDERIHVETAADELGALASAINGAFDRYHDAVDRLRRFTSDASHELRTPLTAMRSTGEVSLRKERSPKEYRESIQSMLEEVQRLSHIVEQLLILARLDAAEARAQFSAVDLGTVTREVAERFGPLAAERNVVLQVESPPGLVVNGNGSLLSQVVANLLDNAISATPAKGHVVVCAERATPTVATLSVEDTGPGIPEAYRERVFDRFCRVPGTAAPGSGLGLAIVADIVRWHGGNVEIVSNEGAGAVLRVRLPTGQEGIGRREV